MISRSERIHALLQVLNPTHLEVFDDSHQHAGHNDAARAGGTHLRVEIVSAQFEGLSRVARHRRVQELLKAEFDSGLHALQINAKSSCEA